MSEEEFKIINDKLIDSSQKLNIIMSGLGNVQDQLNFIKERIDKYNNRFVVKLFGLRIKI